MTVENPTRSTASDPLASSAPGARVLIIGASSGIGRAVAHRWASAGVGLILAGRDLADLSATASDLRLRHGQAVDVVAFDAVAFDTHQRFWAECLSAGNGNLDGVVVLHGHLPDQSHAQNDCEQARAAIDVNFTSAVSVLTLAASYFEARRRGFICGFSSVAGDRGRQSNYIYGSAKAGLSAFLEGLRVRMYKCGVAVVTVKPGFVDTAMTWGLPGMFLVASPEKVADDVFHAVRRGRATVYTPWFWRTIMWIIRSIPNVVFKRLKL